MASAREFGTEEIRNVAVLGHGGSGKTSLVDALCYTAGTSSRHGDVAEGTAVTMFTPEELDHGISMQCTPAHAVWEGVKLNLLDTPGYLDFTGDALAAARAADAATLVLGSTSGVEVGTELVWDYCVRYELPRIFFVSMMDKENADFDKVYEDIKERLTASVVPVEIPIGEGDDFRGIINLFSGKAHIYEPGTSKGEYREEEIPGELEEKYERWRTELFESLATTDETLLEHYLEGEGITRAEAIEAMGFAMATGDLYPLFCGSAEKTYGMRALLAKMAELFPHPGERPPERGKRPGIDQEAEVRADDDEPFAAIVFKTATEPHVGDLTYFRIVGGSVRSGSTVQNADRGDREKLGHLAIPMGKDRFEVDRLHAGDIGLAVKLKDTHTNDTLSDGDRPLILEKIDFPEPDVSVAIRAVSRSDEDKLGEALHALEEEDPTFVSEYNSELKQTICRGLGELHLEVQLERMKRKYGVAVETEAPRIAYRETLTRTAEGQGRHKKQSGGRGQFGDCWIRLKPLPRGSGIEFVDSIKGGVIPTKYVPSVEKGIREAAENGVLAGYPVVDFEAEAYDGSYHSVDSSDVAFQIAGSLAFRKVAAEARPVLLEPIMEVAVTTPDEFVGDVMGDITQRRGKVLGMDPESGKTVIRARIPEAELYRYATALRSMTHGRAYHTRSHAGYEEVPTHVAEKIIEESREEEPAAAT